MVSVGKLTYVAYSTTGDLIKSWPQIRPSYPMLTFKYKKIHFDFKGAVAPDWPESGML
jgi:hypothetical protein